MKKGGKWWWGGIQRVPVPSGPAREPECSSDSSSADRVLSGFVTAQVVKKLRDWVGAQSSVDISRGVEGV